MDSLDLKLWARDGVDHGAIARVERWQRVRKKKK